MRIWKERRGFHPFEEVYDRTWPLKRKAAFFSSVTLNHLWIALSVFYCFEMFMIAGSSGEHLTESGLVESYVFMELPGLKALAVSTPPWILMALLWARWLRKKGRDALSLLPQTLPLVPYLTVLALYAAYNQH